MKLEKIKMNEKLIKKFYFMFGGLEGVSKILKVNITTAWRWKNESLIPLKHLPKVIHLLNAKKESVTVKDFFL